MYHIGTYSGVENSRTTTTIFDKNFSWLSWVYSS